MSKQIKTVIGWINEEDFNSCEKRLKEYGINHVDLFKRNPITSRIKNKVKRMGFSYKKVKITIEEFY